MDPHEQTDLRKVYDHEHCVVCGPHDPLALKLAFRPDPAGGVSTPVAAHAGLQGYTGFVHGGVISALLDAAMTHCLFHAGVRAMTAELLVRFPQPVPCTAELRLRGWIVAAKPPLYRLKAELRRDGRLVAWADRRYLM